MTRSGAAAAAPRRPRRTAIARSRCRPGTRCPTVLMRQPVSPMTTMRRGFGFGSGSARPSDRRARDAGGNRACRRRARERPKASTARVAARRPQRNRRRAARGRPSARACRRARSPGTSAPRVITRATAGPPRRARRTRRSSRRPRSASRGGVAQPASERREQQSRPTIAVASSPSRPTPPARRRSPPRPPCRCAARAARAAAPEIPAPLRAALSRASNPPSGPIRTASGGAGGAIVASDAVGVRQRGRCRLPLPRRKPFGERRAARRPPGSGCGPTARHAAIGDLPPMRRRACRRARRPAAARCAR